MILLSETLTELGIAFEFPIEIKDANGNRTYFEDSYGYWYKSKYDVSNNQTYLEDSDGFWWRGEYDANGKETYYENSAGEKEGTPKIAKTSAGKVVEIDGVKYEPKAL